MNYRSFAHNKKMMFSEVIFWLKFVYFIKMTALYIHRMFPFGNIWKIVLFKPDFFYVSFIIILKILIFLHTLMLTLCLKEPIYYKSVKFHCDFVLNYL